MWTSQERIYLNSKGEPCDHKDSDKQMLLVAVGGQIPLAQAEALGLIKTTVEAAPEPVSEPEAEPEAETPETAEEAPADEPEAKEEAKAVTPLFNKAEKPKKNK